MKKVLLGTSALALAGAFVTPAAAAEWDVAFGGYMEQHMGFASTDYDDDRSGDWDGIDVKSDSEIHFKPSITLDNGLKIGVDVQLEANTSGDQIDESFLYIKGSFGEILLGSENSAGYKMTYTAPSVSMVGVNSGSLNAYIPFETNDAFRGTLMATTVENATNNDAQRITYFSPRFAGFQLGVSYARDGNQDSNSQVDTDSTLHDFVDVGANYVNTFGDVSIALSGRYGIADRPNSGDNPDVWGAGLNLGFGGFTVGGSYARQNDTNSSDGEAWDAGVSYATGPWGFSLTYFNGENEDNDGAGDENLEEWLFAVRYSLAKGVNLEGFGGYVDFEEDNNSDNLDGFVIGTGIKVSF